MSVLVAVPNRSQFPRAVETSRWQRTWMRALRVPEGDGVILGRVYGVCIAVRFFLAIHAVVINTVVLLPMAASPLLVIFANLIILGWTVYFSLHMRNEANRSIWDHGADLGVTIVVLLMTPLTMAGQYPTTLAGYWLAGCALYAAIFMSTFRGALSAFIVCTVFLFLPPLAFAQRIDVVLLTGLATVCTGVLTAQLRDAVAEQERDRVRSAALSERERLYRIVHDGALQVLTLVEREAPALGPRGLRLASLARESESQLRTMLQDREVKSTQSERVDLAAALDKYQSATVTVSTMAGEVELPRKLVDEIESILVEALTNVSRHAGENAQAWVLLDQETDDEVILWIRDNGVGMTAASVAEAARRGRMGIKDSIVGRIAALGGSAMLTSTPEAGTEWELRFPVEGESG